MTASITAIRDGFRLLWLELKDAETGTLYYRSSWDPDTLFDGETEAHVPASILGVSTVSREIQFSSSEVIQEFRVRQSVLLHGQVVEEYPFDFGFVMPQSTNTWSSTVVAAEPADMIPAEILSGNVVIETRFYDGDTLIATAHVRIYYDGPMPPQPPQSDA